MSDDDFTFTDLRRHWNESAEREKAKRASWAAPQREKIHRLTMELHNDGWRDVMYCPKGGEQFLAWSPTMPTPYVCTYHGDWPKGSWWACMDGDMWPDQPVLFKPLPERERWAVRKS